YYCSLSCVLHFAYLFIHSFPTRRSSDLLFVLPRVTSIFTRSAISPGLWLRQQRSRYAIRAGRNLPDKEFRYLRMVLVTTAVYWRLNSQLRNHTHSYTVLLTFQHRAGVSPYTSTSRLRMDLCF